MDHIFKHILVFVISVSFLVNGIAQKDSLDDISALIYLDSFVVVAAKQGFNSKDFIDLVRTDESFLEAFHNLRFASYTSTNDFTYFGKKGKQKAVYRDTISQSVNDNCRTMQYLSSQDQGNYFKNRKSRKYNYFTSDMHDRLFYTHQRTCDDPTPKILASNASRMEKYVSELKKLIFQPGEPANVPFIGDKTSIFTEPMRQYYDFKISNEQFEETYDCYVFEAIVKPQYEDKNKVVIKQLRTYFDKATFQVVARDYQLQYSAGLYQFDVKIKIALLKINDKYFPKSIHYDGFWNVPIKKKETAQFKLQFFDLKYQAS